MTHKPVENCMKPHNLSLYCYYTTSIIKFISPFIYIKFDFLVTNVFTMQNNHLHFGYQHMFKVFNNLCLITAILYNLNFKISLICICKYVGLSDTYNIPIINFTFLNIRRSINNKINAILLQFCLYDITFLILHDSYIHKIIESDYPNSHKNILKHNDILSHNKHLRLKMATVEHLYSHKLIKELINHARHYIKYI